MFLWDGMMQTLAMVHSTPHAPCHDAVYCYPSHLVVLSCIPDIACAAMEPQILMANRFMSSLPVLWSIFAASSSSRCGLLEHVLADTLFRILALPYNCVLCRHDPHPYPNFAVVQVESGQMCAEFNPSGCLSLTDAMPPNMALVMWDYFNVTHDMDSLTDIFPRLERLDL